MDVYKAEQRSLKEVKEEINRPPLAPSEKNIVVNRPKVIRDVPSRYRAAINSSSPSQPSGPRRCPSPNTRVVPSTQISSYGKRAQSAERRRPSTPLSSPRPTTPGKDGTPEIQSLSKRLSGSRTSEGLWSSGTVRSLCVSFQSDTFSLPISRKEKPVTQSSLDHTLKSSSNVSHRQAETPHAQRKATPDRKRTPLRGRNASDQSENSRPTDNSHERMIDQQRWPSRTGGRVSSMPSASPRSSNLTDKTSKSHSSQLTGRGVSPMKRSVSEAGRCQQKSQSERVDRLSLDGSEGREHSFHRHDDLRSSEVNKFLPSVGISSNSLERAAPTTRAWHSMPSPGLRLPSPSRTPLPSSSHSRGTVSPARTRPSAPFPSASTMSNQSSSSSSVLSFISDYRKGKKGANHIEDAHQLRLLHNRYLQMRFVNAQTDIALSNQRLIAEDTLYSVWNTTSELMDSVTMKRINIQQLRQEMKLNLILTEQMAYLEDWALQESEHSRSVFEAIKSLEACTLRLPVTTGAKVDINSLEGAVGSAADVMQSLVSSLCSSLSRVTSTNSLVSELADVTALEKAMVYECGDLLASTAALQVEENSLRTHLIQLKKDLRRGEHPLPVFLSTV
ncbi:hypothetical protein ACHQM5_029984 [Ranunculus cassubicifolius]